jgi:hypothetical protein
VEESSRENAEDDLSETEGLQKRSDLTASWHVKAQLSPHFQVLLAATSQPACLT